MMGPLPLGRVVATLGALNVLLEAEENPLHYLARHASGDWGNLDGHDRKENELALEHGWRVVSSYPVGEQVIWLITEADRSATTILLPEEY
jgi:hypothetical protein